MPLAKIVMNRPLLLRLLWEVTGRRWSQKDDVGRGLLSDLLAPYSSSFSPPPFFPLFGANNTLFFPQWSSDRPSVLLPSFPLIIHLLRHTEGKRKFEFNISPPLAHVRRHLRGKEEEEVLNHILTTGKADRGKRERRRRHQSDRGPRIEFPSLVSVQRTRHKAPLQACSCV